MGLKEYESHLTPTLSDQYTNTRGPPSHVTEKRNEASSGCRLRRLAVAWVRQWKASKAAAIVQPMSLPGGVGTSCIRLPGQAVLMIQDQDLWIELSGSCRLVYPPTSAAGHGRKDSNVHQKQGYHASSHWVSRIYYIGLLGRVRASQMASHKQPELAVVAVKSPIALCQST